MSNTENTSVPKNEPFSGQNTHRKKSKANYTFLDKYIGEKSFDENYALLSHYIQLQDSIAGEKYNR